MKLFCSRFFSLPTLLLFSFCFALTVLAQAPGPLSADGGVLSVGIAGGSVDVPLPDAASPLINDPQVVDAANSLYNGLVHHNWGVVAFALIIIVVSVLRAFSKKISPKLDAFFNHPLVAWALPGVLGILGGILAALLAGQPLVAALVSGLATGALAAYGHKGVKTVQEIRADAATAAVAAVPDKAAALNVLENGPKG